MIEDNYKEILQNINNIINKILNSENIEPIEKEYSEPEIKECVISFNNFITQYKEAVDLAYNLANGNLDFEVSKKSTLAITNGLKSLQSTLKHLTWKIKLIANGDFDQRVNFIGEFSTVFNKMTEQLKYSFLKIEEQNRELKETQKILKEANATKDRFFSIIAHDLKNPFTSLIGFSKLAFDQFDDIDKEHLKEILEMIYYSSKQIYSLLENLLMWGRSQSGNIKLESDFIDIKGIIKENIDVLYSNINQKRIKIELNLEDNNIVFADYNTINTVIRNILSNAIKFSNFDGKIEINTKKSDKYLIIEIKDNGIGIEKENFNKIFAIDKKFSTMGTNKEKGSGLGLIICKDFVEKNKGEIDFTSEVGKGTSFFVKLPLEPLK